MAQFENNYPCQNQEYSHKSCDINSVVKQCYSDEKCSEHSNSRPYRIRCSYRDLLLGKIQKISAQSHCHDCKNQPNNFCTRNRRHFHADGQPISKRAAITRYTQLIAIPFQAKLFCLFRL